MSAVWTITKRDFTAYFNSMRGGVIFWFFLIFMGFFFQSFIYTFVEMQQRAGMMGNAPTLDQLLTAMFHNLHFILLLVVPAITMASFSEEKRTQSIRLLQTAPISATQIVLGKFFACAAILGLVLLASAVYPLFTVKYGNPDVGPIVTSYLGIFLLMCSQVAFGLWISSMTSNQFLAFLFTMFGLFLLLILNWIAPNIASGGGAEQVVKYLASTTHLDVFFKGMLTVSDIAYFIAFISLFLFFTNTVLDSQRWR
ncbi:MAG: ABC transporter permease [Oligoflexales bacterium]